MKKIKEIMREVARSAASTYAFAALAIMSANELDRVFHRVTGMSPRAWREGRR